MIIKGEINREIFKGNDYITVKFSVDELMKNNTPNVNFWTFCLLNDLIRKRFPDLEDDPNEETEYVSKINLIDLTYSEDKEKNRIINEMFDRLRIDTI